MKTLGKIGRARALARYFRDPAASLFGKFLVLLALVYVISPADAIPDVIPVIELGGQDAKIIIFHEDPVTGRKRKLPSPRCRRIRILPI